MDLDLDSDLDLDVGSGLDLHLLLDLDLGLDLDLDLGASGADPYLSICGNNARPWGFRGRGGGGWGKLYLIMCEKHCKTLGLQDGTTLT